MILKEHLEIISKLAADVTCHILFIPDFYKRRNIGNSIVWKSTFCDVARVPLPYLSNMHKNIPVNTPEYT